MEIHTGDLRAIGGGRWLARGTMTKAILRRFVRFGAQWRGVAKGSSKVNVVVGRDGWLFMRNDTNDVMGQITGRLKADPKTLAAIAAAHAARARICEAQGIAYRHVICPNKESIEIDRLPAPYAYEVFGPTYVAQYLETAPAPAPFYERSCLLGRADGYFRTDTHWTEVGAFAYLDAALRHWNDCRALVALSALGAKPARIEVPTDLGLKLGLGPEVSVGLYLPDEMPTLLVETEVVNKGHLRWQHTSRPTLAGARALVLHDSFGESLFRILGALYAETLFLHDHDFDPSFVSRFRPDIVWCFQAERFLPRVPRNDVDFVAMIARNERRKNLRAHGSRLLRETWPA